MTDDHPEELEEEELEKQEGEEPDELTESWPYDPSDGDVEGESCGSSCPPGEGGNAFYRSYFSSLATISRAAQGPVWSTMSLSSTLTPVTSVK